MFSRVYFKCILEYVTQYIYEIVFSIQPSLAGKYTKL